MSDATATATPTTNGQSSPGSETVAVHKAKGRPFLQWVGKKPLERVQAFPARLTEHFDPTSQGPDPLVSPTADQNEPWRNLLFYGDNKEALAWLLAKGYRGQVDLVYIDPPFDSGADYVRKVGLRGTRGSLKGTAHSLAEQVQYEDIWANDAYLQFMYERLLLLRELLAETGSLWLHCDWHRSHQLRCLMDEVFGADNLQNEIIWQRTDPHNDAKSRLGWIHDTILWYAKDRNQAVYNWEDVTVPLSEAALREYNLVEMPDGSIVPYDADDQDQEKGRRFKRNDCTYKGTDTSRQFEWRGARPSPKRVWPYKSPEEMDAAVERGEFYLRNPEKGVARCKVSYLDDREDEGQVLQTIWTDTGRMKGGVEYPTEKPPSLLRRAVKAASNPGDLVLDCFVGSGTTVRAAQELGRRWIGCDINKGAVQTTSKRLSALVEEQAQTLDLDPPTPSRAFGLYQVNNYDLQLRHQDAQAIAAEHVGVERTRTDAFFDGTLGADWAKLIPFTRPLTALDVEEVRREVKRREGGRDVAVVALGVEPEARNAIDQNNRLLPEGGGRIRLVDLRAGDRYGGLLTHEPAAADVRFDRDGGTVQVDVREFVSPTILKRLGLDTEDLGVHPQVEDWRGTVDYVLIDTDYDGETFVVRVQDIPDNRRDTVLGAYTIPGVSPDAVVAIKIVDMLGEEVLVTSATARD